MPKKKVTKKKNVLVTGGCGFIGSNFIRYFYNKYSNYHIFNLDALTYAGNPDNLSDIENSEAKNKTNKRFTFIKGDICDETLIENLFKKYRFDLIIHFAAETHVDRSIFNVFDFVHTNIRGTHSLLEAVRRNSVPRFIYISTDEVYGSVPDGFADEDSPLRPSNPYAASKASADLLAQTYIKTFKTPAIIVRGSNNFGTHQYPEKLIPMAITSIIEGKKVPVHGSGEHIRSWLHVLDFCSAIDLVAHKAPIFSIYNVSGEHKSNIEVLKLLAGYLGTDIKLFKEHVNDRPSADFRYAPDCSKLQKELGWRRKYSVDSDMGDVVKWYLDNKSWWQKIKQKQEYINHYEKQYKAQWY
ncbi:MAG: dTDP-glucose 4,6-dehydratase [Parcubacteria group bacterium Athens0714_26]|nr:MAG: dTDP-glucose 4,6-dehydratase [Parcubacteria group bacterium Athens1014_26]TSD03646.1 MAG: dTDP-glucose 4,6-dehydratase [Parcubacteria group bacterium Athens0714_26]